MKTSEIFNSERNIEQKLRKQKALIPLVTLLMAAALCSGIGLCMQGFKNGFYWTVIPAGILLHSFFIVVVHDGAHKAITRTKFDRLIMNLGAGLMLLPFYAEPFRKYHLIHHAHTNSEQDPLWPDFKKKLYLEKRWLYLLCELIPLGFTFVVLLSGKQKETASSQNKPVNQPAINVSYILLTSLVSIVVYLLVQPPLWFIAGTLLSVNSVKLLRHWCEHMGTESGKESNTYWFPLGMGIGNHEAHHELPHYSWLTMMLGLYSRQKSTNPFKAAYLILFNRSFLHYRELKK